MLAGIIALSGLYFLIPNLEGQVGCRIQNFWHSERYYGANPAGESHRDIANTDGASGLQARPCALHFP